MLILERIFCKVLNYPEILDARSRKAFQFGRPAARTLSPEKLKKLLGKSTLIFVK
jgi:hypothetical protein